MAVGVTHRGDCSFAQFVEAALQTVEAGRLELGQAELAVRRVLVAVHVDQRLQLDRRRIVERFLRGEHRGRTVGEQLGLPLDLQHRRMIEHGEDRRETFTLDPVETALLLVDAHGGAVPGVDVAEADVVGEDVVSGGQSDPRWHLPFLACVGHGPSSVEHLDSR